MDSRAAAKVLVAAVADQVPTLLIIGCCPVPTTRDLLHASSRHGTSARIISISDSEVPRQYQRRRRWPEGVVFASRRDRHLDDLHLPTGHGALVLDCCPTCRQQAVRLDEVARALEPGSPVVVLGATRLAAVTGMLDAGLVNVESRRVLRRRGADRFMVRGRVPR